MGWIMNEIWIFLGWVNIEFLVEMVMDVNGEMVEVLFMVENSDNLLLVDGIFVVECILKKWIWKVRNLLLKLYYICVDFC